MAKTNSFCNCMTLLPALPINLNADKSWEQHKGRKFTPFAAKSGGFSLDSVIKRCKTCGGQGAVECPGCKILGSRSL
ncbi:hypothetical protein U1Q18_036941 [Sarracenia purpurea var. burkii]